MGKEIMGKEDIKSLVDGLNYKEKVERSLDLINDAYKVYNNGLIVANSLGKDSVVIWHLAKKVSNKIRGFIITTPYKPKETKKFMLEQVKIFPELEIFESKEDSSLNLYKVQPDLCCKVFKVNPTIEAIDKLQAKCWVTGLRCTEGRTRVDFKEIEERDKGLLKLNPILIWKELEVWQYIGINKIDVNPLYSKGYRSLGCEPCTSIVTGDNERAGRWLGTSKCGGECGIHTNPLKTYMAERRYKENL